MGTVGMSSNELEVLEHYNRKIQKYLDVQNAEEVLLKCLAKLDHVRVNIALLQSTGVGRTVSCLKKKFPDTEIGSQSRDLVAKWKDIVTKEEETEEVEEGGREEEGGGREGSGADSAEEQTSSVPDYVPTPIVQGYVPTPKEHLVVKEEPGIEKELSGKSREGSRRKEEKRREERKREERKKEEK